MTKKSKSRRDREKHKRAFPSITAGRVIDALHKEYATWSRAEVVAWLNNLDESERASILAKTIAKLSPA